MGKLRLYRSCNYILGLRSRVLIVLDVVAGFRHLGSHGDGFRNIGESVETRMDVDTVSNTVRMSGGRHCDRESACSGLVPTVNRPLNPMVALSSLE